MTGDVYVPSRGNPNASVMLIGEAPGRYEVEKGLPFVGTAGNVLTELLMKAGIDPDECFYTNVCKYQPPTTYPKGGGKPKSNDLSAWIPKGIPADERVFTGLEELSAEIERVNPNVIVPLGNWPLYFLYRQRLNKQSQVTGITDYRGYTLESRYVAPKRKLIPTLHPSYYLHGNSGEAGLGVRDFRRVAKESGSPLIVRRPRTYYIDPQGEERELLRQRLLNEGDILFTDIEGWGRNLKVVGFAVSPDWGVSIRIRGRDDVAWVRSLLESGKPIGAQNATFDLGNLEWWFEVNAFPNLVWDTMVAAYVTNIEHKKDLGFLASLHWIDIGAWWDVISWDDIHSGKQSIDDLLPYNCDDNMVTCEVQQKQVIDIATDPKFREAFEFDMAKVRALWKVSRRGCPLDLNRLAKLSTECKASLAENQAALNGICEIYDMDLKGVDFNVKSGPQVAELLAAYMNIELTKRTKGGAQWATDNRILMEYARRSDDRAVRQTIERVIRVREDRDLESKFLSIEWDDDGRARCIYDPTKTKTRRLSSKEFWPTSRGSNLQNIPAPSSSPKYGPACRECFTCDPGMEFGYADLKGAEFLIVAWLSQDPLMLEYAAMSIAGTGNVHKKTAAFMFDQQESAIEKDTPFYFLGKKMRHSGNYMIGWKELMGRINGEAMETGIWVDAAMVKRMIARYLEMHPLLPTWWGEVAYEAKSTGRLRNLFGFIRVVNDRVSNCLPDLVAFKPQSTVGDCLNYGLVACEDDPELRDYGFSILLQEHDALGYQYQPAYRDAVHTRVSTLMSKEIYIPKVDEYKVIPIEVQYGKAWHPLTDWKPVGKTV